MKRTFLATVLVLAGSFVGSVQAETVTVSFLDVGQGDAILIRSPAGKVALVDTGPSNAILDVLRDEGVGTIDVVIASHHHADHIGGMAQVIRKYKPKVLVDSGSSHTSATYRNVLKAAEEAECQLVEPKKDSERKIDLGSVVLRILPQPPLDEDEENNNSVGIRLEFGKFSVLLTGDSEEGERTWWLENADSGLYRKATILKAAHHGSHNGTNAAWLKVAKPKLVVISCGEKNKYGHPHKETMQLLKRLHVPEKRTDIDGTITIESDGETWKIQEEDANNHASVDRRGLYPVAA